MLCSKSFCSASARSGLVLAAASVALLCQGCAPARVVRNIGYGTGPEPERRGSAGATGFGLSPVAGLNACPVYTFVDHDGTQLTVVPDAFLPVAQNLVLTIMLKGGLNDEGDGLESPTGDSPGSSESLTAEQPEGSDRARLWLAQAGPRADHAGTRGEDGERSVDSPVVSFQLLATAAVESGDKHQIVPANSSGPETSAEGWLVSLQTFEKRLSAYAVRRGTESSAASVELKNVVVTGGLPLHVVSIGGAEIRVIEQEGQEIVVRRYARSAPPGSDENDSLDAAADQNWIAAGATPIAQLRNPSDRVAALETHGNAFLLRAETPGSEKSAVFWGSLDGGQGRMVYDGTVLALAGARAAEGFSALFLSLPLSAPQAFHPVFGEMAVGGIWRLRAGLGEEMVWERLSRIPFQWLNPSVGDGVWATVDQSSLLNDLSEEAFRTFAFASEPAGNENEVSGACSAFSVRQIQYIEGQGLVGLGSWGQMARLAVADSL